MKKFFIILLLLILIPKTTFAKDLFYYKDLSGIEHGDENNINTTLDPNLHTTAKLGFESLAKCEAKAKELIINNDCYSGGMLDITGFSPISAKSGDIVTIEGNNFFGISKVVFRTVEASVESVSPTQIKVKVPSSSSNIVTGQISVVSQWRNWDTSSATFQLLGEDSKPVSVNPTTESSLDKHDTVYNLLSPIGTLKCIDTANIDPTCAKGGIGDYLNLMVKLGIGLCAALAVVLLVINGFLYMGDESVFGKTEAKSKIFACFMGLLISLGAYALLNTINPDLVGNSGLSIDSASIEGDADAPITINATVAKSSGIMCPGSGGKSSIPAIASSFSGKMTYSQDIPKGQIGPKGTIKLDCSGYVNYVIKCAGIDNSSINSGTSLIFSNAEKVIDKNKTTDTIINGKVLVVGDLVGWKKSDDKNNNGHVMIYVGNGLVNDSHGGSSVGNAYGSFPLTKYKDRITYVKRIDTI